MDRQRTILIVDDDLTYLKMVNEWLKEDYAVSLANSAKQAFSYLEEHSPDLILLDYELPEVPGPQLLEHLRDSVRTARIPVIFLTGKHDRESIMRVRSLRPADYLLKSISREELLAKLKEFFRFQF